MRVLAMGRMVDVPDPAEEVAATEDACGAATATVRAVFVVGRSPDARAAH
jgi:hypothetical protein